jgi:phenylpropionate dioxygenase-like ring-hydroxylating dioxygenase large terminal subunit
MHAVICCTAAVYGEIEFNCGHWGVFENAIDMAHIHYLHADSFGNAEKPKVMDMTSTRDTFETTCNFRWEGCVSVALPNSAEWRLTWQ